MYKNYKIGITDSCCGLTIKYPLTIDWIPFTSRMGGDNQWSKNQERAIGQDTDILVNGGKRKIHTHTSSRQDLQR